MRVVVIGGGASGLIAAIYAAKGGCRVTILERNRACGKKILITGNGRCNYWNEDLGLSHYHTTDESVLKEIMTEENREEALVFFDSMGIVPKVKNGYYYPYSNQATTIREALLTEANLHGVEIQYDARVTKIEKNDSKFLIHLEDNIVEADKVILSTGSSACPKTGSDGSGYQLATFLGHSIIPVLPSLVQLRGVRKKFFRDWDGIRADAKVSLYVDDEKIKQDAGEIQLTEYGVSGICIFNLSGRAAIALNERKRVSLKINFMPFIDPYDTLSWFDKRSKTVKNRNLEGILDGFLHYRLAALILKQAGIEKERCWDDLSLEEKVKLKGVLTNFYIDIEDTNSFDKAQVCSGGVPLSEINPKTMESLKTEGLYLIGEILDVDGECGGYNLSFAWVSGLIAGREV